MQIRLKVTKNFDADCSDCRFLETDRIYDDLGCGQTQVAESTYCNCNDLDEDCPAVQRQIEEFPEDWDIEETEVEDN